MPDLADLRAALAVLPGLPCWSVIGGPGTGSVWSIDLGDKVPRDRPLTNPHLTDDQRRYIGAYSLFVHCAWRLDARGEVITGSGDDNAEGGPMVKGMHHLVGARVRAVDLAAPAGDLTVHFDNDLTLRLFCDRTDPDDQDNYVFFEPTRWWVMNPRGEVLLELRPTDP